MQYQVDVQKSVPDFGENWNAGCRRESGYLENGSDSTNLLFEPLLDSFSSVLFFTTRKLTKNLII